MIKFLTYGETSDLTKPVPPFTAMSWSAGKAENVAEDNHTAPVMRPNGQMESMWNPRFA
jgi:hypothetical protein